MGFLPHGRRHLLMVGMLSSTLASPGLAAVIFNGVDAGDMTSSDAILWTRADDGGATTALTAQVSTNPSFIGPLQTYSGTTSAAADYTLKLDATGLTGNTTYYYRFTDGTTTSQTGRFTTAPSITQNAPISFSFSGDTDARFRPYPSVNGFGTTAGGSQNLNFYVFLGDTMYETAATGSPATIQTPTNANAAEVQQTLTDFHRKYLETISGVTPSGAISATGQQGVQSMLAATGTYTLLDNHELGNRQLQAGGAPQASTNTGNPPSYDVNATGAYNNKSTGFLALQQAYLDYHPVRDATIVNAPSDPRSDGTTQLYYAQQWGKNSVFVNVDDRSYRDIRLKDPVTGNDVTGINPDGTLQPGARADNPDRTMLGTTQLAWLKQTLLNAQNDGTTWKFVTISTPIDTTGGNQDGKSWYGGYRAERNDLLKFIADNHIDHVVFLTTDDHQMRVTQLVYAPDPVNHPDVKALVPGAFQVLTGPIGAGGPDAITDHSFANILNLLNTASTPVINNPDLVAHGDPVVGLAGFAGLDKVFRVDDPNAATDPSSIDFYAPDLNGYTTLSVDQWGNLTVDFWGILSYAANTFPQPGDPASLIMSFQIDVPEPTSLLMMTTGLVGLTALRRLTRLSPR
jgi:phosphodiesterase/alkaline phosphatase D-like protein